MAKVRCPNCKEYNEKDQAIHIGLSHFCDDECYREHSGKTKSKKPIRSKRTTLSIDNSIIWAKDHNRCRLCQKSNGLAVHHIFYRSDQSNKIWQEEDWNKILLCNEPCHLTIVHRDKSTWQPLLLGLTWFREVENKYLTIEQLERKINE